MKRNIEFVSNAIKYYINYMRIKKLKRKGAQIGKNVVITIKITFGAISYPNHNTSSGAIATVGIVCVKTTNG